MKTARVCLAVAVFLSGFLLPVRSMAQRAAADPTPVRSILTDPPASIRAEAGMEVAVEAVRAVWSTSAQPVASGLNHSAPGPLEIVLLQGSTFRPWARTLIPEWGIGFARWPGGPIVLDMDALASSRKTLSEILRHELSHVYLGQRIGRTGVPRWFVEGVAQAQSGEWRFLDTLSLIQAGGFGHLPQLSRIGAGFPRGGKPAQLAYRVSLQAVLDLEDRLSDRGGWVALVDEAARGGNFATAFRDVTGMSLGAFAEDFDRRLKGRYGWIASIGNITTLFMLMTLLFLAGVARAYYRRRRRLAEMEEDEADWPD